MYGNNVKGIGSVYPTIHRVGAEHFGVVILECRHPDDAWRKEKEWMHRRRPCMNILGMGSEKRKWRLLF